MSHSNESPSHASESSLNYKLACDLGYELSKNEYFEMYNYAKIVRNEYLKASETPSPPTKVKVSETRNQLSSSRISSSSSFKLNNCNTIIYSEDLWIKHLREYFDNEFKG